MISISSKCLSRRRVSIEYAFARCSQFSGTVQEAHNNLHKGVRAIARVLGAEELMAAKGMIVNQLCMLQKEIES